MNAIHQFLSNFVLILGQITEMIQTKLVLAKGVRSQQDLELMQYGTLKIMLTQQIHVEEELDQVFSTIQCQIKRSWFTEISKLVTKLHVLTLDFFALL